MVEEERGRGRWGEREGERERERERERESTSIFNFQTVMTKVIHGQFYNFVVSWVH